VDRVELAASMHRTYLDVSELEVDAPHDWEALHIQRQAGWLRAAGLALRLISEAREAGRLEGLEEAAQIADYFAADRRATWTSLADRHPGPTAEQRAEQQAHRERGNEAEQIAEAIRALSAPTSEEGI
jgi:hypothetical protein